jgi:hypothetical protein
MGTMTTEHPKGRRDVLRHAGLSESSELTEAEVKRADELAGDLKDRPMAEIRSKIMHGQKRQAALGYDEEIRRAAKICRELTDGKGSPGAKQVAAVRGAIDGTDPVTASGMSGTALRRWASNGRTTKGERFKPTAQMDEIGKRCGDDPFCRGRRLAVILVALDAAAKSGKEG